MHTDEMKPVVPFCNFVKAIYPENNIIQNALKYAADKRVLNIKAGDI